MSQAPPAAIPALAYNTSRRAPVSSRGDRNAASGLDNVPSDFVKNLHAMRDVEASKAEDLRSNSNLLFGDANSGVTTQSLTTVPDQCAPGPKL